MRDTPILFWVISGKNAFQAFFMFFLIFSGVTMVSGQVQATSPLYAALPTWGVASFGAALIIGGLLNFISVYWRGRASRGIILESWSAMLLASACFAFCLLILAVPLAIVAPGAAVTIGMSGLLGLASLGRWVQCKRAAKEILQFKMALAVMKRDD